MSKVERIIKTEKKSGGEEEKKYNTVVNPISERRVVRTLWTDTEGP